MAEPEPQAQNQPAKRVPIKKRSRKPQEKIYSLVNPQLNQPLEAMPRESLLVCLKVNTKLFDKYFKHRQATHKQDQNNNILPPSANHLDSRATNQGPGLDPETYTKLLQANNFLYSQLSIPNLYPEVRVTVDKHKVVFKDYQEVDLSTINHHLNQQNNFKRVSLILPSFENGWPEISNYACWNCTEKFDSGPVGLPVSHENSKGIEYRLEGNFCSYECAARYLFDHEDGSELYQRYDLLNLLYTQVTGGKILKSVDLAPPPLALKKFGGRLSIEEYRSPQAIERDYKIYRHPLKPCPYFLEETLPIKSIKSSSFVPLSNVKNAEQRYKLYRKKPLPSKSHNIETCMNIQVKSI